MRTAAIRAPARSSTVSSPEERRPPPPRDVAAELDALLGPDLAAVRVLLGAPIARAAPLSETRPWDAERAAFLVETSDGRRVKLRRMPSEAWAQSVARSLEALADPRFARVLLRRGRLLVDEWIEGRGLAEAGATRERVAEAGALLGRVHATMPPPDTLVAEPGPAPEAHDAALQADLAFLASSGLLEPAPAKRLGRAAAAHRPEQVEMGLVHGDFCAENLLVDAPGGLRVVDNEALAVGPLDLDLARTAYRWPMDEPERDAFLGGYARHRDPAAGRDHAPFWRIRVLAKSARLRANGGWRRAELPLLALRALSGEL
jgi:aminoglycoside phosphotransferase (APT) family kinase protein